MRMIRFWMVFVGLCLSSPVWAAAEEYVTPDWTKPLPQNKSAGDVVIRMSNGAPVGRVVTRYRSQYAYTPGGEFLGRYDMDANVTYDKSGRNIGNTNFLMALMMQRYEQFRGPPLNPKEQEIDPQGEYLTGEDRQLAIRSILAVIDLDGAHLVRWRNPVNGNHGEVQIDAGFHQHTAWKRCRHMRSSVTTVEIKMTEVQRLIVCWIDRAQRWDVTQSTLVSRTSSR